MKCLWHCWTAVSKIGRLTKQAFLTAEFGHLQTIMRINQVRYLSVDTSMAWSTIFNWKPCLYQSLVVMKSQAFAEPYSSSPGHDSCGQAMIKSDKVHPDDCGDAHQWGERLVEE